jgi:ectoine hydroxylase-related dioxygenase (phytanoyl-CoA dioxygenase family)
MYNIENFESSGYVVIKNFLDQHEVHMLLDDYNNYCSQHTIVKNYPEAYCSSAILDQIKPKIKNLCQLITDQTSITVDTVIPKNLYFDTSWFNAGWHQDHASWFLFQDNQNHLNFHLVLSKENSDQSGLGLIPLDTISQYTSELEHSVSKGAMSFRSHDGYTDAQDDELGTHFKIPVGLNSIAVYPTVYPGDLLLFRGDVIHRTQDDNTKRISLSVRCANSAGIISKSRIVPSTDGNTPEFRLTINQERYNTVSKIFGDRETITIGELVEKLFNK